MKRILAGLALILALPILALAQTKPAASTAAPTGPYILLVFVDGDKLDVKTPDGRTLGFGAGVDEGSKILAGSTIITGPTTSAELQLVPNKTIIKLAKNTTFKVETLAATGSKETNTFAVAAGKIRAVASKGSYDFKGQTAVCGVRGTDFFFGIEEGKEVLKVDKGAIKFSKLDGSASLDVGAGFAADALAAVFEVFKPEPGDFFSGMVFTKLLVDAVEQGEAPAPETTQVETKQVTTEEAASTLAEGASKLTKKDVQSGFMKWLGDVMGLELGSVTIDNQTYAKAVIQPNFNLGKVKMGLYLPIIYSSDMFNPDDWYHPNGNDEWSFGTDKGWKDHPLDAGLDALSDLALKIKYFEFGKQLEDPFFVKVGTLDDLTLGHGLIMRNYANNTEFPAIRRVGFNLGVDGKGAGFEAIVNDLADPSVFATRLYFRPIPSSKFAIGVSGVADIAPFGGKNALDAGLSASTYNDPILVGAGIDLDMPIVKSELLGIRFFADVAAETEYTRTDSKLHTELIFDPDTGTFSNWGAAAGLMGNVLFINWRLEYRYFTGIFQPSLFDSTYDKSRAEIAIRYKGYIDSPASFASIEPTMGIYGEGGFGFLKNAKTGDYKLAFDFGYMWPFIPGQTVQYQLDNSVDEFHAKFVVNKGLIPIFDIHGSIFYDKHGLVQSIANGNFKFLDGNTTFGGELVVPVPKTPNLDVAAVFAAVPYDIDPLTGEASLAPSITLETRFHF